MIVTCVAKIKKISVWGGWVLGVGCPCPPVRNDIVTPAPRVTCYPYSHLHVFLLFNDVRPEPDTIYVFGINPHFSQAMTRTSRKKKAVEPLTNTHSNRECTVVEIILFHEFHFLSANYNHK